VTVRKARCYCGGLAATLEGDTFGIPRQINRRRRQGQAPRDQRWVYYDLSVAPVLEALLQTGREELHFAVCVKCQARFPISSAIAGLRAADRADRASTKFQKITAMVIDNSPA
jgi:hypothetical protein